MAKGDVLTCPSTLVANNASLTIRPAAGYEWLIKNVYCTGAVEFYVTDGNNPIQFNDISAVNTGELLSCSILLTNGHYITVKNVSGENIYVTYDGIQTK